MYRRVCSIQRYDRLDKTLRRFHFFIATILPFCRLFFSFNSPSWSLGCEQLFYFCFPLIIPFLNSKRNLCITLFICLLIMLTGMHLTAEEQIKAYWYVNPITRLPDFFVGVLLYQFYRSIFNKRFLIPPEHYQKQEQSFYFCFLFLCRRHSQSIPLFLLLLATRFFGDTYLCLTKRVYIPVTIQSGLSDRRRNQLQFLSDTFIYYTHIPPNGYSVSMAHTLDDKCPRHFLHHYCAQFTFLLLF